MYRILLLTPVLLFFSFLSLGQEVIIKIEGEKILLENDIIRCRLDKATFDDGAYNYIFCEFLDKRNNVDHCNSHAIDGIWISGGVDKIEFRNAELIVDKPDMKTIRVETSNSVREFTIYSGKPYIRVDYITYDVNLLDYSTKSINKRLYCIYGEENWIREKVLYEKCYYFEYDDWCQSQNQNGPDGYPTQLLYNDFFLLALDDTIRNAGFGRIIYGPAISAFKMIDNNDGGYEFFPFLGNLHHPYTSYILPYSGGKEQFFEEAKALTKLDHLDKTPPQLVSALLTGPSTIRIEMNEPVNSKSVKKENFSFNPQFKIKSVKLSEEDKVIIITAEKPHTIISCQLEIRNLSDTSGNKVEQYDKASKTTIQCKPQQMVIVDETQIWTKGENKQTTQLDEGNWLSPLDLAHGKIYMRYELLNKPSDKILAVQTCFWQNQWDIETCSSCYPVSNPIPHVYYFDFNTPADWWKKNNIPIDWSKKFYQITFVHKNEDCNGKLMQTSACGQACYEGADIDLHVPVVFKVTVIVVAKGSKLIPPEEWKNCPPQWYR